MLRVSSPISHRTLASLPLDWEVRFGTHRRLVETFVDPARFHGTCYRAANWQFIGQTSSHGKAEHCQSGVFVGYPSAQGYGLVASQSMPISGWMTGPFAERDSRTSAAHSRGLSQVMAPPIS
jgi:hypothetical protein